MKWIVACILLTVSAALFGQEKQVKTLAPGSQAPDFSLPSTDDRQYSLGDFAQYNLLVIIFTCNHCPTAQAYEDKIIQLVNDFRSQGIAFVAISPNDPDAVSLSELGYSDLGDSMEDMKVRVKDKAYNFPYLYDGDTQQTSIAYGPIATPHVFVFDKERKLQYSGRIDDTEDPYVTPATNDLRDALNTLLAGKEIMTRATKTFGCSIKWAWKDEWIAKQREEWKAELVTLEDITLDGVKELVANKTDKLVLLNIWATWCGPCVMELPYIVSINRMYRDRDFEFITIATDKPGAKEKALQKLKSFEASNRNYIYTGKGIYDLIDVIDPEWQGMIPYSLLIEPGGKVLERIPGTITPQLLKKQIVDYLGRYYADND